MTLGTVRECSIAGLRIRTQAEGDVKVRKEGIKTTTIVSGSGSTHSEAVNLNLEKLSFHAF